MLTFPFDPLVLPDACLSLLFWLMNMCALQSLGGRESVYFLHFVKSTRGALITPFPLVPRLGWSKDHPLAFGDIFLV